MSAIQSYLAADKSLVVRSMEDQLLLHCEVVNIVEWEWRRLSGMMGFFIELGWIG